MNNYKYLLTMHNYNYIYNSVCTINRQKVFLLQYTVVHLHVHATTACTPVRDWVHTRHGHVHLTLQLRSYAQAL